MLLLLTLLCVDAMSDRTFRVAYVQDDGSTRRIRFTPTASHVPLEAQLAARLGVNSVAITSRDANTITATSGGVNNAAVAEARPPQGSPPVQGRPPLPAEARDFFQKGYALISQKKPAEAAEAFRASVRVAPFFTEGYSNLGTMLQRLDYFDDVTHP